MLHGVDTERNNYVICMYIRLSSEDDDIRYNDMKDESNSITAQRRMLYDYINSKVEFKDCTILERCDDGFSGTHFDNRPQFVDMIEMAKRGEIDCIIVKDFSRFGRDYIELGDYMEQLFPILGIRFISVNDCYDSDMLEDGEIGGLDISFKNLIYDYYARETSKKEKLAWKKSAERGDYRACVTLYGYRKSKDNHFKLEIDPEAAKIVREIFSMKLSGMTSTEIAANLNARNILPPTEYKYQAGDKRAVNTNTRKCFWEAGVVNGILQNEKYTGDMVLLKTEVNRVTGKQVKRAKEDWITVENTHEAIVSREVFEAVAKTIKTVPRSFGKNINVFYCSGCGRKMIACRGAILKCRINVTVTDSRKCVDTTISVKKAEQAILADIKFKCSTFIDMRAAIKSTCGNNEKSLEERICSIEKTMEYIDSAWKNIYSEYADRKISKEEYMIQSQEHKQKKQALAEELDRLKIELKQCKADGTKDSIEVLLQKFRDADELTNEMKETMIEKVIVYPNNALEIYWKPDFAKFFETTNMIIRKEKDRK